MCAHVAIVYWFNIN